MARDRLLMTAGMLMTVGIVGIVSTTWFGGPSMFSRGMSGMMMGGGMMSQDQMKAMMQEMMSGQLPPGIKPKDLPEPDSPGAGLLARYCTQCHKLPSPAMHAAEDWPRVEDRMLARERMMANMRGMMGGMMMQGMMDIQAPSKGEEGAILAYLQQHALKPASPETLGPPGSPGLSLFQKTCSQCHALPDPKLHTAEEWSGVVKRMRKNMEIMGKPVITEDEKDQIIAYLSRHAR